MPFRGFAPFLAKRADIAEFLGHRDIRNTTIYVHLEKTCYPHGFTDDYLAKIAKTQAEKLQLIEAGFEFVGIDPDGAQYYRKRK